MLETQIGGRTIKNCIYNASGVNCITKDDLDQLYTCEWTGAMVSKSCTLEPRTGNQCPRYAYIPGLGSINSSGLPNMGYKYYSELSYPEKEYIISVAGLTLQDNLTIFDHYNSYNNLIEFNLSCPNIKGKPQVGYSSSTMTEYLRKISEVYPKPFGLKLPPYFDISHFDRTADIINEFNISFITCINSIGNGLVIDPLTDQPIIKPIYGGLGGPSCKATGLANVKLFSERLNTNIIGCGGISTGRDVYDYMLCGASACQIGTRLQEEGLGCFKRITTELIDILEQKGYNTIADITDRR